MLTTSPQVPVAPLRVIFFRNARGIADVTGAESYVFALLRALDPAVVQARLLAAIRPSCRDTPWILEARRRGLAVDLVEVHSKFGTGDLGALCKMVTDWSADIVHSLDHRADIVGLVAARRTGVALINSFFGWTNFSGRFNRGTLYRWADRLAQARADAVITDSGPMALVAAGGSRRVPVVVVHNGVDVARFDPALPHPDLRPRFFGSSDGFVIGMVGRVHPNKGQLEFLECARALADHHPQLRFLIVGAAPPGFERYQAQVAARIQTLELGDYACLTNVGSAEIPAVVRSIDVLMAPSYRESFSYSLLEGMSMARPVIATDVGGIREMMVDGQSGLIVPAVEVAALTRAVVSLLADPAQRARLGAAARARVVACFTLAEMARRTTLVYREVCAARANGVPRAESRRRLLALSAVALDTVA